MPALAKRKFVNPSYLQNLRTIETGNRFLQLPVVNILRVVAVIQRAVRIREGFLERIAHQEAESLPGPMRHQQLRCIIVRGPPIRELRYHTTPGKLRIRKQRLRHSPGETGVWQRNARMQADVIQKRISQREKLRVELVQVVEVRRAQPRSFVSHIVRRHRGALGQQKLEAQCIVLRVRLAIRVGGNIIDPVAIVQGRVDGRKRVGVRRIAVVPIEHRIACAGLKVIRSVVAVNTRQAEAVGNGRGVIDSVAASHYHPWFNLVCESSPRSELLPIRVLKRIAVQLAQEDQGPGIVTGTWIGQGRIQARRAMIDFIQRADDVPTQAQIERQPAAHLPVVGQIKRRGQPA